MATLALQRGFFDYALDQRERRWQQRPQRRADSLRVLVLGLGEMGQSTARRLVQLGFQVSGWSLHPRAAAALPAGIGHRHGAAALPGLLAQSDIVINLLPLTPATEGLLDATFFAALPRGAGVVNLARGAHVVDADLLAALDRGQVGRAVLDVFHQEPLPPEHPYWQHPRVTLLPHVAAQTDPHSAAQVVAANVRALAAGAPLAHLVPVGRGY